MVYTFKDGQFRFYTALYGSWNHDRRIVFRVRTDTTPKKRACEKSIKYYDRLVPSSMQEISAWLRGHLEFAMKG